MTGMRRTAWSGEGRRALAALPALVALALLAPARPARAHEMGKLQVTVELRRDATYRVDIAIDEQRVSGFLAAGGGPAETRYGPIAGFAAAVPPAERGQIGPFFRTLAERSALSFDGRLSPPERLWVDRPASPADDPFAPPPKLTLHLAGPIPPGTKAATWRLDLLIGSFPIGFRNEGDAALSRQWLDGESDSRPFALSEKVVPPSRARVARQYLGLGFTHILPKGTDHILFVLGIFLLSLRLKPMLTQVTSFTVAHTLTLALSIYGLLSLPPRVVEPAIALSIVYVAVENVLTRELKPSRVALVFGFGLLHGLGFAGVLHELGLPRSEFLTALLTFNLGVEAGQLTVIAAAFLLVGLPFRHKPWYRQRIVVPASLAIAAIGLYWSIQRIFF
jgi:hydrogenase/urease accessory protein HupE